jgi:acyl carrier protein
MKVNDINTKLRDYIDASFVRGNNRNYKDSDSFFEMEIVDSTGVLELVLFIEETFNIRVEDEEIVPENLDSVNNLVTFILKKTS